MPAATRPIQRSARSRQAGFQLVEVLLTTALLAIAVLTEVSTSIGTYRHSRYEMSRSDILQVGRQFMERLRGDDDSAGLYLRLKALQESAVTAPVETKQPDEDGYGWPTPPTGPTPGGPVLPDGRPTWLPQMYYPDFVHPASLHTLGVLVDVPASTPQNDPLGTTVLREDMNHVGFGLPADLNGDGQIDALSHDHDHVALPVVVTFCWQAPGESLERLVLRTWIRIDR